jgi:Putative auto-transporter adhesin, head GIN domain
MKTKPTSKTVILIFIISLIAQSCRFIDNEPYPLNQSNRIIEEVIPLNNFDRVEMGNAFRVFIRKGSKFSIIAKGDINDVNDLEAKVIDGELNIKYHN